MREIQAVQITAFRRDAQVKCFLASSVVGRVTKRGKVVSFSDRSRSRLLFTAFNASCDWLAFAVLTYPAEFPTDGHKVKRDIDALCKWLRRDYGAKILWGIEFQTRGAPHINLLSDSFIPKGELGMRWFQIVGSGDFKHLLAGTRIEECRSSSHAAGYIAAAYSAKKSEQKTVPPGFENVGRFWGASRGLVRPVKEEIFLVDDALPKVRALRRFTEKQVKARRCQPSRDEKLRLRKVKRKPSLRHLHAGLSGFKSFHGASIAERLLGE
jgi:hypothetical protein